MEKLEPVLKQKFWILLGVAILMTFIGWWMATSQMSAAIIARTTAIEQSFTDVPKGEIPNESWAKQLNAVNADQEKSIKVTRVGMWKRQTEKMTWPEGVVPVNGYWGKFPNDVRVVFRESFVDEVTQVWKMLNPMDEDLGTGVVKYSLRDMFNLIGKGPWNRSPPESEEMWEIREDLWLLESLFQTIASLNGGLEMGRTEAVIHQIDKLQLRGGGDKAKSGGSSSGSSSGSDMGMGLVGPPSGFGGGPPKGAGGMGVMGGGGAGGLSGGLTVVSAEFDPVEEFGDDGSASATGAGGGSYASSMSSFLGGSGGDTSTTTSATTAKPISRYIIASDPAKPFKTRGFYISLKMDHTKIPLLIEELSSNDKSVWPIEIVRVQMSRINEDDSSFGGPSGGGGRDRMRFGPMSQPTMGAGPGNSFGAGLGGASGANDDPLAAFGISRPTVEGTSEKAMNAKAAFDNALRDPVMAQVTICGIFTLYNKVDDLPEPAAAAAPSAQETAPVEANSVEGDAKTPSATDNPSPAATEPADSTDAPANTTDSATPKAEATTEPKAEPKPEPKPDSSEK